MAAHNQRATQRSQQTNKEQYSHFALK